MPAFNINDFKSTMDKYGGPAKSNLFTATIVFSVGSGQISTVEPGRKAEYIPPVDLKFFCSEVSLPPVNLNVASYRANSIDLAQNMPINLTTPSINTTFMLDSDHRVISFFHSWMQEIINYNIGGGLLSAINGDHLPYEIGYKSDYACTLIINHFKTDSVGELSEAYEYTFLNAYPTEVGGKALSWAPSDSISTMSVNFTASSFNFSASDPGTLSSPRSNGSGYLDALLSVGYNGQTVQQSNVPRSVQDAINTFTTVRNDFRTLRNTFRSIRNIF